MSKSVFSVMVGEGGGLYPGCCTCSHDNYMVVTIVSILRSTTIFLIIATEHTHKYIYPFK